MNVANKNNLTLEDLAGIMARGFDAVDKRFDAVDKRFGEMDKRFDGIERSLEDVKETVSFLEEVDIMNLQTRVGTLEKDVRILKKRY